MRTEQGRGRGHGGNRHLEPASNASQGLPSIVKCNRCGRGLSSEASIDRGLGPTCWNKQAREDREQEDQGKQRSLNDFIQGAGNDG